MQRLNYIDTIAPSLSGGTAPEGTFAFLTVIAPDALVALPGAAYTEKAQICVALVSVQANRTSSQPAPWNGEPIEATFALPTTNTAILTNMYLADPEQVLEVSKTEDREPAPAEVEIDWLAPGVLLQTVEDNSRYREVVALENEKLEAGSAGYARLHEGDTVTLRMEPGFLYSQVLIIVFQLATGDLDEEPTIDLTERGDGVEARHQIDFFVTDK